MEKENNEVLAALLQDVRALKKASQEVQGEVKEHHVLLDGLSTAFDKGRSVLQGAMNRLGLVSSTGSFVHIWLLVLIMFVVFGFIFALLRFR